VGSISYNAGSITKPSGSVSNEGGATSEPAGAISTPGTSTPVSNPNILYLRSVAQKGEAAENLLLRTIEEKE
jgi:hypothetical protein